MPTLKWAEHLPEIHAWYSLIVVGLINATNATFREENPNERWIVLAGPIFNGKSQWVCELLRWIGEFQETVHRNLQTFDRLEYFIARFTKLVHAPECN